MHSFSFTQPSPEPSYQHKLLYRHAQAHPNTTNSYHKATATPPKPHQMSNEKHNSSLREKVQEQIESQRKSSRENSKVKESPRKI